MQEVSVRLHLFVVELSHEVEMNDRSGLGSCDGRGVVRFRRVQRLPCGELLTLKRSDEDERLLFVQELSCSSSLVFEAEVPGLAVQRVYDSYVQREAREDVLHPTLLD